MEASALYRLSPELRNHIYEHVFSSKYAVTLQDQKCQHALTQTCKQLRHETLAMYYSLTSFNAHLDDGPATPLIKWLEVLGAGTVCRIDRINIWDLHMLQFTLHGLSATRQIFSSGFISSQWHHQDSHDDLKNGLGPRNKTDDQNSYILRPVDIRFAERNVKAVFLALHSMGLGLARFVVVTSPASSDPSSSAAEEQQPEEKMTSEYAIVPLQSIASTNPWAAIESLRLEDQRDNDDDNIYSNVDTLQKQLELSDAADQHLQKQLLDGERTVTIREKRRVLVLEFDPSGTRLVDFRQAAMSEASHDMLHSVVGAMRNWRALP
ncbi:hypothetical protein Slin14017_G016500 [Septoria linicola]|nr:hypothetical protein Slin14017_G016500 [Septoria linicola]